MSLAEQPPRRGDLASAAADALAPVLGARPWSLEPSLSLAAVPWPRATPAASGGGLRPRGDLAAEPARGEEARGRARASRGRRGRRARRARARSSSRRRISTSAARSRSRTAARCSRARGRRTPRGDPRLREGTPERRRRGRWYSTPRLSSPPGRHRDRADSPGVPGPRPAGRGGAGRGDGAARRRRAVLHGEAGTAARSSPSFLGRLGRDVVSLAGLEPGDRGGGAPARRARIRRQLRRRPVYFQVAGVPLFRSSYVVSAPEGLGLGVDAHGMPAPAVAREAGRECGPQRAEPRPGVRARARRGADAGVPPFVQVGAGADRAAISAASATRLDRTRPTEELRALAAEVRAEAGEDAAPGALRARRTRARRADDPRSDSALGEDASAALSSGRGSRLVVLKALLSALGLRTRIALARPFSADAVAYRFPNTGEFTHPLLRVEAGRETFGSTRRSGSRRFGVHPPSSVLDVDAMCCPSRATRSRWSARRRARSSTRRATSRCGSALRPDGGGDVEGRTATPGRWRRRRRPRSRSSTPRSGARPWRRSCRARSAASPCRR